MDYKIIIIGAGYAGLAGGIGVSKWSDEYIILEQRDYIGQLRTTGGIAGFWIDRMKDTEIGTFDIAPDNIATTIKDIYLYNSYRGHYALHYDHSVGYLLYPDKLEINMAKNIKDHIQLKTHVQEIKKYENGYMIKTDQGTYTTHHIINASGIYGPQVASIPKEDIIIGYEKTIKLDNLNDNQDLKIFFDKTYAPNGYVWDFSGGAGIRRVGLGFPMSFNLNPKIALETFMKSHDYNGELIHTLAHPIPVAYPLKTVVDGNMAFIGDAGRFVFASTGGGIQGAILSGLNAGYSLKFGDFSYYEKWYKHYKKYLIRHYKIKKLLYSFTDAEFERIFQVIQNYQPKTLNPVYELGRLVRYIAIRDPTLLGKVLKHYVA